MFKLSNMVVGNGSIAKLFIDEFKNNSDIVIFASGVSDSNEIGRAHV